MVEGITILNKTAVTGLPTCVLVLAFIAFVTGLIVFAVSMILDGQVWITTSSLIISLSIMVTCGILKCIIKTGEYRYECIINDSVPYNEVADNYKIIEQRGDIWVLEDK
nr:MAG TPA: hypothetical protein [Caudoviricetes sp.]